MTHAPNARPAAKTLSTFALVLLACALIVAQRAANAQSNQAATPQGVRPVETVRLDVIFTDKSGRTVTDVRPEDVRVMEDGAPQTVTRFALEELPVTFAVLADNSRSLVNSMDAIIRTAATVVSFIRPADEAAVIRFVDAKNIRTVEDFTGDRESLVGAAESMYVEGGQTAVIDALRHAVEKVAGRGGDARRRAVVLITDGEERESRQKSDELAKFLRERDVQVFVIAFVHLLSNQGGFIAKAPREKAIALMTQVAQESGGRAFFPKDGATLRAAVEEIARNLRAQYSVEYRPNNAARDGKFRKVEVKVAGDRKAFTRPGYFAGN